MPFLHWTLYLDEHEVLTLTLIIRRRVILETFTFQLAIPLVKKNSSFIYSPLALIWNDFYTFLSPINIGKGHMWKVWRSSNKIFPFLLIYSETSISSNVFIIWALLNYIYILSYHSFSSYFKFFFQILQVLLLFSKKSVPPPQEVFIHQASRVNRLVFIWEHLTSFFNKTKKRTTWLQWKGENSTLNDGWWDSDVFPQGWIIKMLLAGETLSIFLLTGISKLNIFFIKKRINVVFLSNICFYKRNIQLKKKT